MPSPTGSGPITNLGSLSGPTEILALLGGSKWGGGLGHGLALTYSFPWTQQSTAWWDTPYGDNQPSNGFGLSAADQDAVRNALRVISTYIDVRFSERPDGQTSVGDLRFARTSLFDASGEAYLPDGTPEGGDVWLDSDSSMQNLTPGTFGYGTALHEICHALGLKHPFEGGVRLPTNLDNNDNTVMSYTPGYYSGDHPGSLMPFDVSALQALYGANRNFNRGNTVYDATKISQVFGMASQFPSPIVTLWDAGGTDTFIAGGPLIDLRSAIPNYQSSGTVTRFSAFEVVIAKGVVIENARATQVGARITGNSADNDLRGATQTNVFGYDGAIIRGLDGDDTIVADRAVTLGAGTNALAPSQLFGDKGNDDLFGFIYRDNMFGGTGNDALRAYGGDDQLRGDSGNDFLAPGSGVDFIDGGSGTDTADFRDNSVAVAVTLNGSNVITVFLGGVATDTMRDVEIVYGGSGSDDLIGDGRANTFRGGLGGDLLDGGGGADTADYADKAQSVVAILNGATFVVVTAGGINEDVIRNIENVTGGTAGDVLTGDGLVNVLDGRSGNDTLNGAGGRDELIGGLGRDRMTGGDSLDDFNFFSIAEIGKGATRDIIIDFQHGVDDIDLSAIDANGSALGNGRFVFLAKEGAAFTGARGQLRWDQQNSSGTANDKTIVEGDINGDRKADFQIQLTGIETLSSVDFFL